MDNNPQTNISTADEILKWKQLLDVGAITREEFNAKKNELLNLTAERSSEAAATAAPTVQAQSVVPTSLPQNTVKQNGESNNWQQFPPQQVNYNITYKPADQVSDIYVWALVLAPECGSIIFTLLGFSPWLTVICLGALELIFLILDRKETEEQWEDSDLWFWVGILVIPAYLIARAHHFKKSGYVITWTVLFVIDLCILLA